MENTPTVEKINEPPTEFINLIKELINDDISTEDIDAIDIAVKNLIEIKPSVIIQQININEVSQIIHGEIYKSILII